MGRTLVAVCLLLSTLLARDAWPCASAPPEGQHVYIAEEEAIIVFDAATKTETFIRRAAFQSDAASFGFLVPTPTVPQLGELSNHTFDALDTTIAPETKFDTSGYKTDFTPLLLSCMLKGSRSEKGEAQAPTAAVQVLQTARVAGFDATTIAADNADAMATWLADHGYAKSPELTEWLARYVDAHWTITAFVVAKDDKAQNDIATSAVRMTFQTERPFYPYREPRVKAPPAEGAPTSRKLRMHFISDARYAATLVNAPWSAPIAWAAPLPRIPKDLEPLVGSLRFATVFDDESFPRNGIDEVYFARDTEQREIKPAPFIIKDPTTIWIPVDGVVILCVIVFLITRKIRKYRRSKVGRF